MFSLSWDIEELKKLSSEGRILRVELSAAFDVASNADIAFQQYNMPRKLSSIRECLGTFVKGVVRFRRTPATHIFVIMISSELRDRKPYALPVQCIPYAGLNEGNMRRLINELVKEMVGRGMKVSGDVLHCLRLKMMNNWTFLLFVGFVSNGEFNYMRSKGYTRPLSVLQIRTNVRSKYNKICQKTLLAMLTPKRKLLSKCLHHCYFISIPAFAFQYSLELPDGTVVAKRTNPAVPSSVLREISDWLRQGATLEDAVDRLRARTVPAGYEFHTWQPG